MLLLHDPLLAWLNPQLLAWLNPQLLAWLNPQCDVWLNPQCDVWLNPHRSLMDIAYLLHVADPVQTLSFTRGTSRECKVKRILS